MTQRTYDAWKAEVVAHRRRITARLFAFAGRAAMGDDDLAKLLGVTRGTIVSWRSGKQVPRNLVDVVQAVKLLQAEAHKREREGQPSPPAIVPAGDPPTTRRGATMRQKYAVEREQRRAVWEEILPELDRLRVTESEIADLFGVQVQQVYRWRDGRTQPRSLERLEAVRAELAGRRPDGLKRAVRRDPPPQVETVPAPRPLPKPPEPSRRLGTFVLVILAGSIGAAIAAVVSAWFLP